MTLTYNLSDSTYNNYVSNFSQLTEENGISTKFDKIAKLYTGKQQHLVLAMMLEYAIVSGRVDIIEYLLDLGANPYLISEHNYIHELLSDNDIDNKIIIQMESVINMRGYKINLTIDNDDIFSTKKRLKNYINQIRRPQNADLYEYTYVLIK